MNQTSDHEIVSRYRRVKGSGLFHVDEFCAVTGYPTTRVLEIMEKLELSEEVIRYGHGVYLLKPSINPRVTRRQYDWTPDISKLRYLLSLITVSKFRARKDIRDDWPYSDTSLTRYLRTLQLSNYIEVRRIGSLLFYKKINSILQRTPSWQELTRRNNA